MEQPTSQTAVFEYIDTYPFHTDSDFREGLAQILGHPEVPVVDEELNREDDLVLQAKCYYIARRSNLEPAPDPAIYKDWLASKRDVLKSTSISDAPAAPQKINASASESNGDLKTAEPSYPPSFAEIVDLISTGKPIPGILHVPDTVLTGCETASKAGRRPKPWENTMSSKEKQNIDSEKA